MSAAEDAAAVARAVEIATRLRDERQDAKAKSYAKRGWGIDDLVVKFGLSREHAKRIVFDKSKEGKAS